jgi:hypothetical protein
MMYTIEMASCGMIYILSFMEIGTGIQVIQRLCRRKLKGYNFCILFYCFCGV